MDLFKSTLLFIWSFLFFASFSAARHLASEKENFQCQANQMLSVIRQRKMLKKCQFINTLLESVMQSGCSEIVKLTLKRHVADRFAMTSIPMIKECQSLKEIINGMNLL